MIVCIDGTGPYDAQEYEMSMARSFCYQLAMQTRAQNSMYIEGPGGAGGTTYFKASSGYDRIHDFYDGSPRRTKANPLFLAGYSRGGACAIQLAKWLNADKSPLEVQAMFLFDPVCRDLALDAQGIPGNVRNVYVLYRDQTIETVNLPWNPDWGYGDSPDRDIYARKWMGNCDCTREEPMRTGITPTVIKGASHGAAGGLPWTSRPADEPAVKAAAAWMTGNIQGEGLGVNLRDMYFIQKRAAAAAPALVSRP